MRDVAGNWLAVPVPGGRRPRKALITGCPRSGTGYTATVLRAAGIASGHEEVYGPLGVEPWGEVAVEVSWLAAPSLPVEGVPAAHQIRDPLAVVRSLVGIRFFEKPTAFLDFAMDRCPRLRDEPTAVSASIRMWCEWTRMVEAHAVTRWRVEDTADEVSRIAAHVGGVPDRVRRAVERVPPDVNHRRRAPGLDLVGVRRGLWAQFKSVAEDLGYDVVR